MNRKMIAGVAASLAALTFGVTACSSDADVASSNALLKANGVDVD